jgi:hypothetical protein
LIQPDGGGVNRVLERGVLTMTILDPITGNRVTIDTSNWPRH